MLRHLALISLLAVANTAAPALAQDDKRIERVQFDAGTSGTTITDSIKGYEVVRYVLGASAGQQMNVTLKTAHNSTYFNVVQPSKPDGPALAVSEQVGTNPMVPEINRFSGTLPENGDYAIEVWMYRSAARRNEVADFALEISIDGSSAAASAPSGDYADGMSGGPDYWAIKVNTTLNIHAEPSTSSTTVARLPNGFVVQNLGCKMAEGRKWCHVADGDAKGWAAGEYLVEAVAPGTSSGSGSAPAAGTPNAAEQACLRDVTATTNNPDVVLLNSEFSEAGTLVTVGVGENKAPWKCIAYKDGTTAGIEFMGEG